MMIRWQSRVSGALVAFLAVLGSPAGAGAAPAGAGLELGGFVQSLYTVRIADAACGELRACELMLGEQHLQGQLSAHSTLGDAGALLMARIDVVHDLVLGASALEPLELYAEATYRSISVRAGRQVITWGAGDLVFVTDVFPKDWESFFLGRSLEYLKPGVDAIRMTMPHLDLVVVPRPALDRMPGRDRFVLPDGPGQDLPVEVPDEPISLADGEIAARLSALISGWEVALVGAWTHDGAGVLVPDDPGNPTRMQIRSPRLFLTGASIAGPVLGGVYYLEGGYQHANDDPDGTGPLVPSSTIEGFTGYTHALWQDAGVGVQASVKTFTKDDSTRPSRHDWMVTARFTQQLVGQTVDLAAFVAWGITQRDGYGLLTARYRYNDALSLEAGANLFVGVNRWSRFGSLVDNSNLFTSIRYGF